MKSSSIKQGLIGFSIAFILLFFAFRGVNFKELSSSILEMNLWFFIAAVVIFYIGVFFRILRFQFFIEAQDHSTPLNKLSIIHFVAGAFNRLMPFGFGEFYRILAAEKAEITRSEMVPPVYVSGILDLGFLLIMGLVSSLLGNFNSYIITQSLVIGFFFILLAIFFLMVFLKKEPDHISFLFRFPILEKFEDKLKRAITKVRRGFKMYNKSTLFLGTLLTLLIWSMTFLSFYSVILGFGIMINLWFVFLLFGTFALLLDMPLTPGGLGIIELFLVGSLSLEVTKNLATSVTLVYRFINYLSVLIVGILLILVKRKYISFDFWEKLGF